MNFSGAVTGGDLLLIKPHFGETIGGDPPLEEAKWDFNRDGAVTGGDFAQVKAFLDNLAPACP